MSNGVFNFNFVALLLSEILGGSQIYTRGSYAPSTPPNGEIFVPKAITSQYLIVFILGDPKFTLGGPVPLCTPPSGKIFVPEASTLLCLMGFSISTF